MKMAKNKENKFLRCTPTIFLAMGILLVVLMDIIEETYLRIMVGIVFWVVGMCLLHLHENSLLKLENENKQLKQLLSADVKEFCLNRKDFSDRCDYIQRCMMVYRANKGMKNTIPVIGDKKQWKKNI